jgi:peptidoglycan/LPS O-acetylase OafA/YrhL
MSAFALPQNNQKADNAPDSWLLSRAGQGNNFAATGYIRFLLAIVVVVSHSYYYCHLAIPFINVWPTPQAAVCGFFVLSGWVIAGSVSRDSKGFYVRRIERLMPVYVVCLLWAQAPFHLFGRVFPLPGGSELFNAPPSRWYIVFNLFFLQNFINVAEITFAPAWSMSCEVFYYLFAPILNKTATRWLFGLALLSLASYLLKSLVKVDDVAAANYGVGTAMMAWAWVSGFIAYRLRKTRPLVSILLLCSLGTFWLSGSGWLVLLTGLALLFGDRLNLSPILEKTGVILGDLSYPLYLSHLTTLIVIAKVLPESFHRRTVIALFGAVAVAAIILFVVDIPCQAFFKRGRFQRAAQAAAAVPGGAV